jgi:predicted nucleotidyltransferase
VRSFDSVKVISLERDKLLTRLEQIARKIITEHREVKEVRLFGSLARGDQVGTSDVDILIILENDQVYSPLEQVRDYYPFFNLPIGVDRKTEDRRRKTDSVLRLPSPVSLSPGSSERE